MVIDDSLHIFVYLHHNGMSHLKVRFTCKSHFVQPYVRASSKGINFLIVCCMFECNIELLYSLFRVNLRPLNFICWRFRTLCSIFLGDVYRKNSCSHDLWRWNRVSRNVGTWISKAAVSPKRKNTTIDKSQHMQFFTFKTVLT